MRFIFGLVKVALKAVKTFVAIEFDKAFRYMWHQGTDGKEADHRRVRVKSAVALRA